MALQRASQPLRSIDDQTPLHHHHQVQTGQLLLIVAETLADHTLYAVAINRTLQRLFRDGQSEPGVRLSTVPVENGKAIIGRSSGILEYPPILGGFQQPSRAIETLPFRAQGIRFQGARRARPLARRALITLRPLRVAMRARKPWVRARLRLLG